MFNSQWLDVNTDLFDLIGVAQGDDQQPYDHDLSMVASLSPTSGADELSALQPAAAGQGATALEILQSLADDNERNLSTGSPQADLLSVPSRLGSIGAGSSVLMGMLLEGLDKAQPDTHNDIGLDNYMDIDVDEQLVLEASLVPILSPVSPEDVETLLSSGPCSPLSVARLEPTPLASPSYEVADNSSEGGLEEDSSDETWQPSYSKPLVVKGKRASSRSAPYSKTKVNKQAKQEDRKLRKKQQNRDAALRYRQKKKDEAGTVDSECDILEKRNRELKDKVDQMTREIQYLKDLMADVHRARGLKTKSKK